MQGAAADLAASVITIEVIGKVDPSDVGAAWEGFDAATTCNIRCRVVVDTRGIEASSEEAGTRAIRTRHVVCGDRVLTARNPRDAGEGLRSDRVEVKRGGVQAASVNAGKVRALQACEGAIVDC